MPEGWSTQNSIEVGLCAIFAIGAVLGIGYVVWHTLPYIFAAIAGASAVALYVAARNTSAPNL